MDVDVGTCRLDTFEEAPHPSEPKPLYFRATASNRALAQRYNQALAACQLRPNRHNKRVLAALERRMRTMGGMGNPPRMTHADRVSRYFAVMRKLEREMGEKS